MLLNGRETSAKIEQELKRRSGFLKSETGVVPGLVAVLVGDREDSKAYVDNKVRACSRVGFYSDVFRLPENVSYERLQSKIERLNGDPKVHGIIVQLPLPEHIDKYQVVDLISPGKDVDGLTATSIASLSRGSPSFEPCTPKGIVRLLDEYSINIQGANVVVVGREELVGRPLANILSNRQYNSTVTLCYTMLHYVTLVLVMSNIIQRKPT